MGYDPIFEILEFDFCSGRCVGVRRSLVRSVAFACVWAVSGREGETLGDRSVGSMSQSVEAGRSETRGRCKISHALILGLGSLSGWLLRCEAGDMVQLFYCCSVESDSCRGNRIYSLQLNFIFTPLHV